MQLAGILLMMNLGSNKWLFKDSYNARKPKVKATTTKPTTPIIWTSSHPKVMMYEVKIRLNFRATLEIISFCFKSSLSPLKTIFDQQFLPGSQKSQRIFQG